MTCTLPLWDIHFWMAGKGGDRRFYWWLSWIQGLIQCWVGVGDDWYVQIGDLFIDLVFFVVQIEREGGPVLDGAGCGEGEGE